MHLGFHGGQCCGIKVISNLWCYPAYPLSPLDEVGINDIDKTGGHVNSSDRFYHLAAPKETYLERLDRYINYVKVRRPQQIVEIVLAEYWNISAYSQLVWAPILEERGFKLVNKHQNSNTQNTIYVYHLNVGPEYIEPVCEYSEDDEDEEED